VVIPKQLPKGLDEASQKEQANNIGMILTAIVGIVGVAQLYMRGHIDDIWSMFLMV